MDGPTLRYDPTIAAIRFGTGLGPRFARPASAGDLLEELGGPDRMAEAFQLPGYDAAIARWHVYLSLRKQSSAATTKEEGDAVVDGIKAVRGAARADYLAGLRANVARAAQAEYGFRERLVQFWADHFTVGYSVQILSQAISAYVDEAIRPNLAGDFATLLKAAVTHVAMLLYLDQTRSAGPNSRFAKNNPDRGLNENLAREVLELHTLGVDADYSQSDVRQLAELFTGLSFKSGTGFVFRQGYVEPGAETVLGQTYKGGLEDIHAALDALAAHPATARHLARKLAVHFVDDNPPPALVDHVAAAYSASGGNLSATYAALLEHPSAWAPERRKVRQPFDYIAAALRALGVPGGKIAALPRRRARTQLLVPLQLMGQSWQRPDGPDGLPESAGAWVTPQGMAARIQWGMRAPQALTDTLPDPRDFVVSALGGTAGADLNFAAGAAATRAEGIGLVLASPEFQRR
ncbi:MAG: DUF1800 domain-containing protein [Paracoccaceae bacterium]